MTRDVIVEEVRAVRDEIAKEYDYDIGRQDDGARDLPPSRSMIAVGCLVCMVGSVAALLGKLVAYFCHHHDQNTIVL